MKANLKVTSWYLPAQSKPNIQNVGIGTQPIPTNAKILHSFRALSQFTHKPSSQEQISIDSSAYFLAL